MGSEMCIRDRPIYKDSSDHPRTQVRTRSHSWSIQPRTGRVPAGYRGPRRDGRCAERRGPADRPRRAVVSEVRPGAGEPWVRLLTIACSGAVRGFRQIRSSKRGTATITGFAGIHVIRRPKTKGLGLRDGCTRLQGRASVKGPSRAEHYSDAARSRRAGRDRSPIRVNAHGSF